MSVTHRARGVKVLKAVSSPLRLQILNLLFDRGELTYTELMNLLKMNPNRDAGRFAYHLKFLLGTDLVETDAETKKYGLTELGKMVLEVADRVEKKTLKPKGTLVRTSHSSLEEFDANKIVNSLIKEAKMPAELGQKVAKEAEKRLFKAKTRYLTAPLVREIVNAILIEKGLEDYRHKLTRLGLPVHEVTALIESNDGDSPKASSIRQNAAEAVLREYSMLKFLPRDLSDAHLAGLLHISDLSALVLEPHEIVHDVRFFFENDQPEACKPSPHLQGRDIDSALYAILNVILDSAAEVRGSQILDYFNVFLAPFVKGLEPLRIKHALASFVFSLSHHADVSLGIELVMPSFIKSKPFFEQSQKSALTYGDFEEESQLLASIILDLFHENSALVPMFNPRLVIKIRKEAFCDERSRALLLKAHRLASENGIPYFVSLSKSNGERTVFSGLGNRYTEDSGGDWEIDTLRIGCLGIVNINLPCIAYVCEKNTAKFMNVFRERLEMATRAAEIKNRALEQRWKNLLPFLSQGSNGDHYFRFENSSSIINLLGLKEASEVLFGSMYDEKALKLASEMAEPIQQVTRRSERRRRNRLLPAMLSDTEASERLAQLDIERYGFGTVKFSGTRDRPFYSAANKTSLQDGKLSQEFLAYEKSLGNLRAGGGTTIIELGDAEHSPEELVLLTRQAAENGAALLVYSRRVTCCVNCRKSWLTLLRKCPSCGATGALRFFDRHAVF